MRHELEEFDANKWRVIVGSLEILGVTISDELFWLLWSENDDQHTQRQEMRNNFHRWFNFYWTVTALSEDDALNNVAIQEMAIIVSTIENLPLEDTDFVKTFYDTLLREAEAVPYLDYYDQHAQQYRFRHAYGLLDIVNMAENLSASTNESLRTIIGNYLMRLLKNQDDVGDDCAIATVRKLGIFVSEEVRKTRDRYLLLLLVGSSQDYVQRHAIYEVRKLGESLNDELYRGLSLSLHDENESVREIARPILNSRRIPASGASTMTFFPDRRDVLSDGEQEVSSGYLCNIL